MINEALSTFKHSISIETDIATLYVEVIGTATQHNSLKIISVLFDN
jgi:hypothetical protein